MSTARHFLSLGDVDAKRLLDGALFLFRGA
jgi:hypothetical protein